MEVKLQESWPRCNDVPGQHPADAVERLLCRHIIKSIGLLTEKISSFLQPVKDDLGLKTVGVYSVHCECGLVCISK
jgi:hypothetical protein